MFLRATRSGLPTNSGSAPRRDELMRIAQYPNRVAVALDHLFACILEANNRYLSDKVSQLQFPKRTDAKNAMCLCGTRCGRCDVRALDVEIHYIHRDEGGCL